MKTKFLILFGIMMSVIGFTSSTFAQELSPCTSDRTACFSPSICENTMWDCPDNSNIFSTIVSSEDMRGGGIDLDPDLSPSYAWDFMGSFFYLTILPLAAMSSVIAGLFLVPYFILKRKKIPSRPYMVVILSGLLLHYSITEIIRAVNHFSRMSFLIDKGELPHIAPLYVSFLIPIIVLIIAGILLYRSSVIRKLIKR